jgi:nucleotide-binding universal stress UspA family protein
MYKNILIANDGSELAGKAVSHGLALAKELNAAVTVVTVTELWPVLDMVDRVQSGDEHPLEDYEKRAAERANKVLTAVSSSANDMGLTCETVHVPDQHPAEGIIATAKIKECDLIVMASHGRRGVKKLLLGSVANEVLTHCSVPVLIYR